MSRRLNIPIPDALTLEAMAGAKRTARMSGGQSTYQLLRETFFDTPEGTLRENQVTLCLRAEASGRQVLELRGAGLQRRVASALPSIQKGTRVLISLWNSLMFGRVPGTRPNISESHSEISTRVPFCTWYPPEH